MLLLGEQKAATLLKTPLAQLTQMPDGYAKFELLLQALESALEYSRLLEAGCYMPETAQGKIVLALCDEIGNHVVLPGYRADSDSS